MRYFYDLEFVENGRTIQLLSLGMVSIDGRELYLQTPTAALYHQNPERCKNLWVRENVVPHLDGSSLTRKEMQRALIRFVDPEKYGRPEFWGYYSAYDHVGLCQIFGPMIALPPGWPMYTRDLRQYADRLGIDQTLDQVIPTQKEHNALADARWNLAVWKYLDFRDAQLKTTR